MMADSRRRLRVACTDERGRPLPLGGLARWLERVTPRRVRGAVTVALVSDARMRALNCAYRRSDYATDVLSFAADAAAGAGRQPRGSSWSARRQPSDHCLGDIVIARGVAAQQARRAGHSTATELRILALHGLLHLLGYDHEHDDGEMTRVEARLRARGGLTDSLIDRAYRRQARRAAGGRANTRKA